MNLTVPIPDRAATALAGLAKARGQTPEQVIATLVEHYLEDAEDLADALEALDDGEAPIPLEQVKRDLGF
jgi:predicted DNA-binding protein